MFDTIKETSAELIATAAAMQAAARAPRNIKWATLPNGDVVRMTRGERKKMARERGDAIILGQRDGSIPISPRYRKSAAQQQAAVAKLAAAATSAKPKRVRKPATKKVA